MGIEYMTREINLFSECNEDVHGDLGDWDRICPVRGCRRDAWSSSNKFRKWPACEYHQDGRFTSGRGCTPKHRVGATLDADTCCGVRTLSGVSNRSGGRIGLAVRAPHNNFHHNLSVSPIIALPSAIIISRINLASCMDCNSNANLP